MKFLYISLFALLLTIPDNALAQSTEQTFLVGEVSKLVIHYQNNKRLIVVPGDELPLSALITIPKEGRLVVYNKAKSQQYIITQTGTKTLKEFLIKSRKENIHQVLFSSILKLITSREVPDDGIATIDRGSDSTKIIEDVDTLKIPVIKQEEEKY